MFDQKFDYLNTIGAELNAVGDEPVAFEWIDRQTLRGIPMTGIRSSVPHDLVVGVDRVEITPLTGTWNRGGVYDVQAIMDVDDGSYRNELIVIHQNMLAGETASGTWKKVPATTPLTPYACPTGYKLDPTGSFCIGNLSGCPEGQEKDSTGACVYKVGLELPPWAIWVGVGLVVGLIGWFMFKKKK